MRFGRPGGTAPAMANSRAEPHAMYCCVAEHKKGWATVHALSMYVLSSAGWPCMYVCMNTRHEYRSTWNFSRDLSHTITIYISKTRIQKYIFNATIDLLKHIVRYEPRRSAASGIALELEKKKVQNIHVYQYIYICTFRMASLSIYVLNIQIWHARAYIHF